MIFFLNKVKSCKTFSKSCLISFFPSKKKLIYKILLHLFFINNWKWNILLLLRANAVRIDWNVLNYSLNHLFWALQLHQLIIQPQIGLLWQILFSDMEALFSDGMRSALFVFELISTNIFLKIKNWIKQNIR